jgi:hypothetical protein
MSMTIDQVRSVLAREPFAPLRLYKTDGTVVEIPFRHVAVFVHGGLLVFKGVKNEKSHVATGYQVIGYDYIERIEPKRDGRSKRPTKKAG